MSATKLPNYPQIQPAPNFDSTQDNPSSQLTDIDIYFEGGNVTGIIVTFADQSQKTYGNPKGHNNGLGSLNTAQGALSLLEIYWDSEHSGRLSGLTINSTEMGHLDVKNNHKWTFSSTKLMNIYGIYGYEGDSKVRTIGFYIAPYSPNTP